MSADRERKRGFERRCTIGVVASCRGHYGRTILEGICHFARLHPRVHFRVLDRTDERVEEVDDWEVDGLIGFLQNRRLANQVLSRGLPAINVSDWLEELPLPSVGLDGAHIGMMGAEHLMACGMSHFAFVGPSCGRLCDEREAGFIACLRQRGHEGVSWKLPDAEVSRAGGDRDVREMLRRWLQDQPRPLGVLACFDEVAYEVTEACRLAGILVPQEVAVLGVDDDPQWCDLAVPPLSSVQVPGEQVGFKAAQLMEAWLIMGRKPTARWLLPARGIQVRQSTDVLAIRDPQLGRALRFLREHACQGIGVEDVLDVTSLSRRTFERRLARELGCTPLEEIHRVRVEQAQRWLSNSDLPIAEIAARTGFGGPDRLAVVFQARQGVSPSAYRRKFRSL